MKKWLFALFIIATVAGCSVDTDGQKQAIKDTILNYNRLLAEGYARMNMSALKQAATEEQVQKVYFHMAALGEAKIRMESELKKIEFSDIRLHGRDAALVKTKETWDYTHFDTKTKKPERIAAGVIYDLEYKLIKKGDRWFVDSVKAVEEEHGKARKKQ